MRHEGKSVVSNSDLGSVLKVQSELNTSRELTLNGTNSVLTLVTVEEGRDVWMNSISAGLVPG